MNTRKLIKRALQRTLTGNLRNTADITLRYVTGLVRPDLNDQSSWSGTATAQSKVIRGLVHFVSPATILNRGFIELRAGDAIVDLDPAETFDGMANLVFEIDGRRYVQKGVGKEVEVYYDLVMGGERMMRTLVLSIVPEEREEPTA